MGSSSSRIGIAIASLLVAGCASFELPPLSIDHPANPDAASASRSPRSHTLAYGPADVQSVSGVPSAPVRGAAREPSREPKPANLVVGEGEVVATIRSGSQIVLEHGEIKGFMEPMTMGYRVDPPSLLDGLSPGDTVRFTIDVPRRAVIAVEKRP